MPRRRLSGSIAAGRTCPYLGIDHGAPSLEPLGGGSRDRAGAMRTSGCSASPADGVLRAILGGDAGAPVQNARREPRLSVLDRGACIPSTVHELRKSSLPRAPARLPKAPLS